MEWDAKLWFHWPNATAVFQSEYTGGDDGRAYPITLRGEIRGDPGDPTSAEAEFANTLGGLLPLLALSANAAVADPRMVASYGARF